MTRVVAAGFMGLALTGFVAQLQRASADPLYATEANAHIDISYRVPDPNPLSISGYLVGATGISAGGNGLSISAKSSAHVDMNSLAEISDVDFGGNFVTANAKADGRPGSLGIGIVGIAKSGPSAFWDGTEQTAADWSAHAQAEATFDDLRVSGGPSLSSMPLSVNVNLHGEIIPPDLLLSDRNAVSSEVLVGGFRIEIRQSSRLLDGPGVGFTISQQGRSIELKQDSSFGDLIIGPNSGGDGYLIDSVLHTPIVFVNSDEPISITLVGVANLNAGLFEAASFNLGTVDFENTFSFATSGPAFDIPDGYTINSVSANIVDNHWLGADVPEPRSLTLIATGLFGAIAYFAVFGFRRCAFFRETRMAGRLFTTSGR